MKFPEDLVMGQGGVGGGQQLPSKKFNCTVSSVGDHGSKARPSRQLPPTPPQLHSPVGMSREAQLNIGLPSGEDDRVWKTVSPKGLLPEAIGAGLISSLQ